MKFKLKSTNLKSKRVCFANNMQEDPPPQGTSVADLLQRFASECTSTGGLLGSEAAHYASACAVALSGAPSPSSLLAALPSLRARVQARVPGDAASEASLSEFFNRLEAEASAASGGGVASSALGGGGGGGSDGTPAQAGSPRPRSASASPHRVPSEAKRARLEEDGVAGGGADAGAPTRQPGAASDSYLVTETAAAAGSGAAPGSSSRAALLSAGGGGGGSGGGCGSSGGGGGGGGSGAAAAAPAKEDSDAPLCFRVIRNDGDRRSLVWLTQAKNIFATQLPKMPREYIARLVFDRKHRSLLALKRDRVIGGITFRPFLPQGFAEIAFCAVTSSEQVRGYGTRLMNHLKQAAKMDKISNFLTYADNFAIGYFRKNGFSKTVRAAPRHLRALSTHTCPLHLPPPPPHTHTLHAFPTRTPQISMAPERWVGFIKDYDGGTLMDCLMCPAVDYLNVPAMIAAQREYVLRALRAHSEASLVVHPGLTSFGGEPRDLPGLKEAGWENPAEAAGRTAEGGLKGALSALTKQVHDFDGARHFIHPVDTAAIKDYTEKVKTPMGAFSDGCALRPLTCPTAA